MNRLTFAALTRRVLIVCSTGLACALLALSTGCSKVEVGGRGSQGNGEPGVLRVSTGRFDTLNTVVSAGGSSVYLSYLWGAFLFIADDKMRIVPELATEIPTQANGGISPDGLTITYHLRRGVTWHDGAPFTAADVIFSWQAVMNPRNNVPSRLGYEKIAAITAPDPYTVKLRLKERYAPMIAAFFGPGEVPFTLLPKHILGGLSDINRAPFNNRPVGTGPFIVQSYDPSEGVILTANPHYWRGLPRLRGIDYRIVTDPNTTMVMMRTRELDVAVVSDTHARELAGAPGIKIISEPAPQNAFLSFNVKHPPVDDVLVRRAIAMGVDRRFFVHAFQYDVGAVANGDEPPFYWAFDPNVRMPDYDPAAAARLLDQAGWHMDPVTGYRTKSGKRLSVLFVYITGRDPDARFAPVFQNGMKQLGIAVEIKNYPYNVFYAPASEGGILNGGKYDIASTGWVLGADPEEAALWMCDQYPPRGFNWSFFCDPQIDALERIALTSYDQQTRRQAYWKIQELLTAEVPVVFLSWVNIIYATQDTVADFQPGETWWASWAWRKE